MVKTLKWAGAPKQIIVKTLVRYYKVGKLLHFVALLAAITAAYLASALSRLDTDEGDGFYIQVFLLISFISMSILAELDGFSRFQNYKQVKDQLFLNGYQERLLKPLLRSSCQREAAILAGDELGLGKQVRDHFYEKGYRWYHIIPDFVFQYPFFFFTAYFWRTTFFTPYYRSKVDYSKVNIAEQGFPLRGIQINTDG